MRVCACVYVHACMCMRVSACVYVRACGICLHRTIWRNVIFISGINYDMTDINRWVTLADMSRRPRLAKCTCGDSAETPKTDKEMFDLHNL